MQASDAMPAMRHHAPHCIETIRWRTFIKGLKPSSFHNIYICYMWVNYNDLTATSLGVMVNKGNHPQMAASFRLVNYYN